VSLEAHSSLAAHDRITLIDDGRLLFPPRKGSALEPVCGMLWRCSTDDLYPAHSLALIQPIHSALVFVRLPLPSTPYCITVCLRSRQQQAAACRSRGCHHGTLRYASRIEPNHAALPWPPGLPSCCHPANPKAEPSRHHFSWISGSSPLLHLLFSVIAVAKLNCPFV